MKLPKILFVDDQKSARSLFVRILDKEKFESRAAESVVEAEALLNEHGADVVVTDLRMPGIDGLEGLQRFHKIDPDLPVVLITAFGSVETAVEAMKLGAFDYVRKPFEPSELIIVIERALQHRRLVKENAELRSQVAKQFQSDIVCESPAMQSIMALVARVAPSDYPVLIQGESGTGKDVFARLIHKQSLRAKGPYVSLNCSAIPEHLLESELFGYEKGAFSGADAAKEGFFSRADGGTLFLDEIGDMSTSLQPKLLRVLQDGEYYAVGSRKVSRADVRLVCASNQDIPQRVERGEFRKDLYYRINTVCISLPPLRDRVEDIPALIEYFLGRINEKAPSALVGVSRPTMHLLLDYAWPGNVRQLLHVIERAALISDGELLLPEALPIELKGDRQQDAEPAELSPFKEARRVFETRYFRRLLEETAGNVQKAAELAGIHRTTLYEKLGKLKIEVER
jgi:two-component system, NtrC family, response regulator AtoC